MRGITHFTHLIDQRFDEFNVGANGCTAPIRYNANKGTMCHLERDTIRVTYRFALAITYNDNGRFDSIRAAFRRETLDTIDLGQLQTVRSVAPARTCMRDPAAAQTGGALVVSLIYPETGPEISSRNYLREAGEEVAG